MSILYKSVVSKGAERLITQNQTFGIHLKYIFKIGTD